MEQENKEIFGLVVVILFITLVVVAIYLFMNKEEAADLPGKDPAPVAQQEPPAPGPDNVIRNPIPETPEPETDVPAGDTESTAETETTAQPQEPEPGEEPPTAEERRARLVQSVVDLLAGQFDRLFLSESLVRHFVVTIDNMTREKLPQKYKFTQSPPGKFRVEKASEDMFLDPANYDRYNAFVSLTDLISSKKLVEIYIRHYELFQEAYESIGYPNRYFNDRLVEVIDHLLATPRVEGRIELEQPKVFYTYADPRLEALSAGQKLLIRIGPDNATKVRAKLQELRELLTAGT